MLRIIIIATLLVGCESISPKLDPPTDYTASLAVDEAVWLAELKAESDQKTGWPSATDCDGALWAGLANAGGGAADLNLAESAPGAIIRSPSGACSPTSRDMILGYAFGRWAAKDLAALQRLANYGEKNNWYMSSDQTLSSIDPISQGILGRAIEKLSNGEDKRVYAGVPMACLVFTVDYEQHLQTLEALLDGQVEGKIPVACLAALQAFQDASPGDAFFAAAVGVYKGDLTKAEELLTAPNYVCPTYVRGAADYCLVHKVFTSKIILGDNHAP